MICISRIHIQAWLECSHSLRGGVSGASTACVRVVQAEKGEMGWWNEDGGRLKKDIGKDGKEEGESVLN